MKPCKPTRPVATSLCMPLAVVLLATQLPAEAAPATAPAQAGSHWTLGVGVATVPEFEGSDEYEAQPVPVVDVGIGPIFAKTGEGIGFNVIDTPIITAGASIKWMPGYDDDEVPAGIDKVDGEIGARVFASTRLNGVTATIAATQAITDTDRGLLINAGVAYPMPASKRLTITPSAGTTWADDNYMTSYFGIDPSEAAASDLDRYDPTSGFKDIHFRVSASDRITDSINALGSVGITHLLGEAADSPLVERKTQPTALLGLAYTF